MHSAMILISPRSLPAHAEIDRGLGVYLADISTISLPETLKSIGTYTFYKASLSGTVALPDSLTQLGASAFSGCEKVEAIQIGSGLTDIPKDAFDGCKPKTITVNNRREMCTSRKSMGLPSHIPSLSDG